MAFAAVDAAHMRDIDYLIPVPLHSSRLRERGYNQSDLLAADISDELSIPCLRQVLVRARNTRSMTALSPLRRRRNVADAFRVIPGTDLQGKHIVLVDDVFTTGATADACARILVLAGCAEVHVLTAARAF
jgi:ComF family protein